MRVVSIILFVLSGSSAFGQYYDKLYFLNWSINEPLTNKRFVGNTSTRGGRVGFQQMINENFAAGLDFTWASYDDYVGRQTYTSPTGALTTDFFKYVDTYGATVAASYYFFTDQKFMPYVGAGVGASYNEYKLFYNVFSSSEGSWGLLLRPQAGAWYRLNDRSSWALHGSVQFDFSTARNTDQGYKNFSNLGFQIGVVKLDW